MGMRIKIWGARGSIPSPGPDTVRVGGNTTCVEITSTGKNRIIIDSGTGIRPLGIKLVKEKDNKPIFLLLTHSHWDHLSGFTFFSPAFIADYSITIFGSHMAQEVMQHDIFERHDNRYSPVNMDNFRAKVTFNGDLSEPLRVDDIEISVLNLNHPGNGNAYRFDHEGHSFGFITDNEIGMHYKGGQTREELIKFIKGLDVLVHDAQYLPSEINDRRGWGHSTYEEVIDVVESAGVPYIFLTHHDPERDDEACNRLLEEARNYISRKKLGIFCELAIEGNVINIG